MNQRTIESCPEAIVDLGEKKPIRVLHVDDELGLLRVAKQCLELQGPFQVDTAGSVDEALSKLKETEYDAVVSDYQMPGKDGLEFLEMLRKSGNTIPFIMFTGKGREEVAVKAWSLGADHYVNKTGDPESVYCELAHCLRSTVEKHFAEAQMKETVHKLQTIYQNAVEGITYVDAEENIIYANKAFADIIGCEQDQLAGMNVRIIVDDENWAKIENETKRRWQGESSRYEVDFRRRDGTVRNALISGAPILNHDGRFIATIGIVLDITEQKKAEEAARQSEEKFKCLVESSSVAIGITDLKGHLTYLNKAIADLFGYSISELQNKPFIEYIHPKEKGRLKRLFLNAIVLRREPYNFEFRALRKDGQILHLMTKPTRLRVNGKTMGFQAIITDMTERKKAEEELKSANEKLKLFSTAVKASADGFVMSDLEGRILEVNEAALRLYKANDNSDLVGKSSLDLVIPEEREKLKQNMREGMAKGHSSSKDVSVVTKEGARISVDITTTLVRDTASRPVGFLGTIRDVTERKKTEEALRNSEDNYRSLFEKAGDGLVYVDLKGKIININAKAAEIAGVNRDQLIGKSFLRLGLIGWKDIPMLLSRIKARAKGSPSGTTLDLSIRRKDGEQRLIEATPTMLRKEGKPVGQVAIVRDVTEKRNIERSLRESQARFEGLFIGNPEAAAYLDSDFRIQDVNPRFEELFGYSLEEVKGKDINDVVVPSNLKKEGESLDKEARKGYVYRDTLRKRKDGVLINVSVSAAPIVDDRGVSGVVAMYHDISDRKNAEKRLDAVNEKLRVVGSLTRHDVRNKLTAVVGNAYLLKKRFAGDPDALECLKSVETAIRESERIFDFAGAYEKLGVEQLAYVDVKKTIDEAAGLFPDLKGIRIVNDCGGLTLLADSLLRQLFYNLVDDSLKYGEKLTQIRIHHEEFEDKLKLIYEDDGVGISKDAKRKLFTEGFTTGKGSGYGLYLIKRMMDVYGWAIEETGEPGKGARFVMTIPRMNTKRRENYKIAP